MYKDYLHQTVAMEGSTEYAIFACFNHYLFALHPLIEEDRLAGLHLPISVFYGDRDWMNREGIEQIMENNAFKDKHSRIYYVTDSDHHMYFDNPEEFS